MPNMKNNASAQETRRKLVEAAGSLFADRGLHAVNLKEITDMADVNSTSINYHFRDKYELYAEVIRYAINSTSCSPPDEKPHRKPTDRLRDFIQRMISDFYDSDKPSWRAILVAHELAQPTAALDAVVDELMRPRCDYLSSIIRDILGPNATDKQILQASLGVVSHCFPYIFHQIAVQKMYPELFEKIKREEMIDFIFQFSLAALQDIQNSPTTRKHVKHYARRKNTTRGNGKGVISLNLPL